MREVESYWTDERRTLATFSVRSGFDLLLQSLDLKPGDEVIFSAINVKGMAKIARAHDLVPVPLDLDVGALSPSPEQLEKVVTPRSKVLVVAHLFGALLDLDALIETAHRHNLVVAEDCAQAFDGHAYPGHPQADISMFSFGPLKTATALGGGLMRVRDADLCERMRAIRDTYPIQSDKSHFKRVVKFCLAKLVSIPTVFGLIYLGFRLLGRDYEDAIGEQVRNVAPQGKAGKYRKQPSTALLKLLVRRLKSFGAGELDARTGRGEVLRGFLGDQVTVPGTENPHHNYWVFPILAKDPQRFIDELKKRGYDSSGWIRSKAVPAPADRPELYPATAARVLHDLIFVPCYPSMSDRDLEKEAQAIIEIAEQLNAETTDQAIDVSAISEGSSG